MAKKLTHLIKYVGSTRNVRNLDLDKGMIERKRSDSGIFGHLHLGDLSTKYRRMKNMNKTIAKE